MDAQRLEALCRSGVHMVVGGSDTGKSTLVRELAARLAAEGRRAAVLDGDIGQSQFGLPATLTLALPGHTDPVAQVFVGATSPPGHLLPLIVGLRRLLDVAHPLADTVLIDTTGLVEGDLAVELKLHKVDCLRPDSVIARAHGAELEPILAPLRRRAGLRVVELPAAPEAAPRSPQARRAYRARKFAAYFRGATCQPIPRPPTLAWGRGPGVPETRWKGLLVGLNDARNFSLGAALVLEAGQDTMHVLTPVSEMKRLRFLRFGSLWLDAASGEECPRMIAG